MKSALTLCAAFAALAAPAHCADSLSFVKVGHRYKLQLGLTASVSVVVVSDAGGGWYSCRSGEEGALTFVNFNSLLEVTPEGPAVSSADAPAKGRDDGPALAAARAERRADG